MHTAVVKLDALTDTVGSTANNKDFFLVAGVGFTLLFISGVHISRGGRELRSTGIDALVDRTNLKLLTMLAHSFFRAAQQQGEALVREAFALQAEHAASVQIGKRLAAQRLLKIGRASCREGVMHRELAAIREGYDDRRTAV